MGSILKKRKRDDESKSPARKKSKQMARMFLPSTKGEMKSVDVGVATISIDTGGTRTLVNGTIPGNGLQNRLGRRIRMQNLHVMGHILQFQAGTAADDDFIHFYVVYDNQTNGATFALSDFLLNIDNAGTTQTNTYCFMNMANAKRFKILRHWKRKMECIGNSLDQPAQDSTDFTIGTVIDMFIPLKGLDTQYNAGVAGTVADITTGGLFFVVLGGSSAANTQYAFRGSTRLRFQDL